MQLLHLDSSITGDHSASRAVSREVVETLKDAHPGLTVRYRDLAADPIAHLTLPGFAEPQAQEILDEFLASDIVVIGAPMYNFTIGSQLKAWLDRIIVGGKTFRYGPNGPEGLAGGRRVIVVMSRGGIYSAGSPAAAMEHAETLLAGTFGFLGIQAEFIVAEGLRVSDEMRDAALAAATAEAKRVAVPSLAA